MVKKCNECKDDLDISKFCKMKASKDGYQYKCITCLNKLQKESKYYQRNSQLIKDSNKKYREKPENKEKKKELDNTYYQEHKEEILIRQRPYSIKYNTNKYKTNINYKIACNNRNRIRKAIKKNQKAGKTIQLLGCNIEQFKIHLESQFTPKMSWDNHGSYWEIDHIRPCASFDLSQDKEQFECFNFINHQPLLISENRKKYNKWKK